MENEQEHKHFRLSRSGTRGFHLAIIVILGLAAIGIVIILGLRARLDEESAAAGTMFSNKVSGAQLSVVAPKTKYKVGETFPATIMVSTDDKEVIGVDVQLQFDPAFFEPVKTASAVSGYLVTKDSVFDSFPGFIVNPKQGSLSFSAIKNPTETFKGNGKVAATSFKVLKKGVARLEFVVKPKQTTDTNVTTAEGRDILGQANSLEITVE